jgi:hypothetical protein
MPSTIRTVLARALRSRVALLALLIAASYIIAGHTASAMPQYLALVPNASSTTFNTPGYTGNGCAVCHGSNGAGAMKVPFFNAGHSWTPSLATSDSDLDGYTNGEELQDPTGSWAAGSGTVGSLSLVTNPSDVASYPPQPNLSGLSGVGAGNTSGQLNLSVTFNVSVGTLGARKVVYDIISGSSVVKSYTKQTGATYGGYTPTAATFDLAWDTNDVPNGSYTVRATLTDARARTSAQSVANVTVNNPSRTLRYVATTGSDSANNCTNSASPCKTIDQAIAQSQPNDEIRVAKGTYTPGSGGSALTVATRVKLIGGFTSNNWTTPDSVVNLTILDGQSLRQVLVFQASAAGFVLQNFTIQNGKGGLGGGVNITSAPGILSNDVFSANTSTSDGGGLYITGSDGTVIKNTVFRGNSASGAGGALVLDANNASQSVTISNVLFANNTAGNGGALVARNGGSATISFATIAGSGAAEAILASGSSSVTLNDALISGYAVGVNIGAGASATLNKVLVANDGANNVAAPTSGAGSISGSPIRGLAGYKNAAAGDYHLAFGAPAIDAGIAVAGVATDLDGQTRPFTTPLPKTVLTPPDIGAFEYSSAYGILYFLTANQQVTLPATVVHVQINLQPPLSITPVTVHYATQDGDAIAGVDYTAVNDTRTIAANDSDLIFDIPILATNIKTARAFTINMISSTVAQINIVQSMMVTINPPDLAGPPRVILTASAPQASRDGQVPGLFTLTRDVLIDSALTVHYTVGGTAVAGVDYRALPGSVTFQPGQTDVTIMVLPIGGSGDKLLTLTLAPDAAYLLGRSSGTVAIVGNLSYRSFLPISRR